MKNNLNTLLRIRKYFPLAKEFQDSLDRIEQDIINSIRKDVKKMGTSPYLEAIAENGDSISHVAIKMHMNKLATEILKYKNAYMKRNAENKTMAFVALDEGNIDICLKIIDKEDLSLSSKNSTYFFMEAAKLTQKNSEYAKIVSKAIKNKRYLIATDRFKQHIGFYCARYHLTRLANEIILEHPEIACQKDYGGDTMGHIAYDEENNNVLTNWLANATLRRTANNFGQTIPHIMAQQNYKTNLLLPYLEDIKLFSMKDYLGNTPAHYLFHNNQIDCCKELIKQQELLTIENKQKETIVDIAYHNGTINEIYSQENSIEK